MAITAASQKKAEGLKDAYVSGLIDAAGGGEFAQAAADVTGANAADTATITYHLDKGRAGYTNDGKPVVMANDSRTLNGLRGLSQFRGMDPAYPIPGGAYGAARQENMTEADKRAAAQIIWQNQQGNSPILYRR